MPFQVHLARVPFAVCRHSVDAPVQVDAELGIPETIEGICSCVAKRRSVERVAVCLTSSHLAIVS